MPPTSITLKNTFWQTDILPQTGASIAAGRIQVNGRWRDVMRPTPPEHYGNSSYCASFLLIPWSNRIRDGILRFRGAEYRLQTTKDDGTARHGDVRNRPWQIISQDEQHIRLKFDSADHQAVNFPFHFSVQAAYRLDGPDFHWRLSLKNEDSRPFPAGFGHHPYFLSAPDGPENGVLLEIPFERQYTLTDAMPDAAAGPLLAEKDFRTMRPLGTTILDDLYTGLIDGRAVKMAYPAWKKALQLTFDPIFEHLIGFAPPEKPFYAVEPVTNANDGFNLYDRGIAGSGIFVLEPGEEKSGDVVLTVTDF